MSTDLTAAAAQIVAVADTTSASRYAAAARATSTVRAYAGDLASFTSWCEARGLASADPAAVAAWVADLADSGAAYATIQRRLTGLRVAARLAGIAAADHPMVAETLAGVRRTIGTAQRRVAPATRDVVEALVETCDDTLTGLRDRALVLLGFAGAFRRSELVALTVADLADHPAGIVVTIRRSKTDQAAAGRQVPIPRGAPHVCPVRAVRAWLAAAGITDGPVLRSVSRHGHVGAGAISDRTVALVIQSRAAAAGLDPALYAGHSLRAGLATSAAAAGVAEADIMRTTGHASAAMVRRYVREGTLFARSAAAAVLA
jgi:site-specific recombinase XerD